jgi:hypothetical protein
MMEQFLARLEDRLSQLQVKYRVAGVADAAMWLSLEKLRALQESAMQGPYGWLQAEAQVCWVVCFS